MQLSGKDKLSVRLLENAKRIDRMRDVLGNLEKTSAQATRSPAFPTAHTSRDCRERQALNMSTAVSRVLERLKEGGGLQRKDIANILEVSPATVSRWSSGKATPDLRTQTVIAELRYVVDRLADFYSPDETRLRLHARHPMLNNERAIDLINQGRTEEVLAVIEALDAGAYT